ncbi:MAG TPA: hypothetical protein VG273_14005 [Bryobacteraceae bacterium]|nr:hypothetical protein [Bryobacteraceae bacterium]
MKKALRLLGWFCAAGIVAASSLVVAALIQYFRNDRPIEIPAPRGPHPVGRILADWKDAARDRELMVFMWYPAQGGASGKRPEYIPGKWGELKARGMFPDPAKRLREIRVNSIENATPDEGAHPVLVMLPGMGRIPADYTTLAEDLASEGYVVAGVTPTGSARPGVCRWPCRAGFRTSSVESRDSATAR